ncbi:MAG: septum site-determining protein MinC [Clostridia bacterium]|nr:septum site-determining protein MinC [Clostridia bacterium]
MRNPVGISMKKDTIMIRISEGAEYKEIIECLNKKIPALKKLYREEKNPIKVTGKILKNKEIEDIKKIIKDEIDVDIEFESPNELGLHGIKKAFEQEIKNSDTKFYKGSVRSGQKIEFEGSLVVLGDVNGGAEVIAGENIVVLGALRGLAHAGAKGNKMAVIATNKLECPQIRIANIVKEIEKEEAENNTYKYVFVDKEEIVLE